jgi:hypothetical protein
MQRVKKNMPLTDDEIMARLEKIRNEYRTLNSEYGVDAFTLSKEIKSFINDLIRYEGKYEELRREAEDMLMRLFFILQDTCCSPKPKSLK